jgi:hypothetical protein
MSSADLTHQNGFGSALWQSGKAFMAASSSSTLRCIPRLIGFSVSNAKKHQHHRNLSLDALHRVLVAEAMEASGG